MKPNLLRPLLSFALLAFSLSPSSAAVTVNMVEEGGDVVATGNGTINTAGLPTQDGGHGGAARLYNATDLQVGGTTVVNIVYWSPVAGPKSFGPGSPVSKASSGSGDGFGIYAGVGILVLPKGYVSGAALAATSTWTGTTFTALGLTAGTYVWKWGTGATADSLTLNIGPITPISPTIDVGKKGNPGERFTATGGSYLLPGAASNADQIRWNLLGGVTHKVAVSGTKWSVKISPLKKGANVIQISGWNTKTNTGSKPLRITITRK